ncbi:MAG: hypothetical protein C4308_06025 [Chitinophagaceae bacterium]
MDSRSKKYLVFFICFLFSVCLQAQDSIDPVAGLKPPKNRELFHDYVDRQQKELLKSDGKADNEFRPSADDQINYFLTRAVTKQVDWIQYRIEKDSALNDQMKKKYLRGLENVLKYYGANWRRGEVTVTELPAILDAYEKAMRRDIDGKPFDDIINQLSYSSGMAVMSLNNQTFEKNPGYKTAQHILVRKYCTLYPDKVFLKLRDNTDVPFFDSLVKVAAYRSPSQLYDFAAASNKLAYSIRRIDDPLIKAVSQMATSNSGRWYFPFLDNIVKGKMTIGEIDEVKDDSVKYFRLLVKTHLEYVDRAINKDTAFGYQALEKQIEKKAREVFVATINALHEIDDPKVRFRIIQPLTAEELYYVAVTTDGEIYTSSFVKGVYPLMMSKAPGQHGDSLLMNLRFDKYRKFIKMAAGYNTLSNFFSSFADKSNSKKLMQAFVGRLEQGSLEDGVDVADSYASIYETIPPLAAEMLNNVQANYQRNVKANDKKGIVIYNLLNKLFLSADTNNHIDLSKEFGIPPVYNVPFNALAQNGNGPVIMQVFFYGDKDGQGIFKGFQNMFDSKNWKITNAPYWINITSVKGKPVSIYANKPLPEETGEDEKAQQALDSFLLKNNLHPTVVIHRGHSYYAPYTIDQIQPSAKIVFMGSCGGYHLIHDILQNAPDAHIIASKQIGKTAINRPFFAQLMEDVRQGRDIDWIPFWQELNKKVNVEGFEDYIPPYKNLGAIFIKAYTKQMGEE